ncbi:sensor histidine kinase [Streptomyces spongiicola]|uniref:sensor histidine kinase n=1 Tax=Streptomyces spongiicola TaxID=1690221 RepID=UPI0021D2C7AF|nr:histidine kinase [Streptomyces spongiicola]
MRHLIRALRGETRALWDKGRALWGETGAPVSPGPGRRDRALAGVLVPVAVLEGVLRPDVPWRALSLVVGVGLIATLLWRRTRPLLMVLVAFGTLLLSQVWALVLGGGQPGLNTMMYMLLLPYALFRWGSKREAMIGLPVILVPAVISVPLTSTSPGDAIAGFALLFAAMALGEALRYRAYARARQFEQVKLVEREQLARDLHDTVAHHVSAIAIRAQAGLAVSAADPAAAGEALRVIETEASRTLAEMRSMVRVLRRADERAGLAPLPLATDLDDLRRAGAGPAVDVEITGDVAGLAPALSTAVYRLVQESVTNARRHARHASRIAVRVAADERSVHLRVSDDGDAVHPRTGGSPGYGLLGMAERAGLLGGSLSAGPDPGRGWTVTAVLPRNGSAS